MAERKNHVNVRAYVRRDLWANVKAWATKDKIDVSDVLEKILAEYFKVIEK